MSEVDPAIRWVVEDAVSRAEHYQRRAHRAEMFVATVLPLRPRLLRERRAIVRDAIKTQNSEGSA